jgi:hypothetical protein
MFMECQSKLRLLIELFLLVACHSSSIGNLFEKTDKSFIYYYLMQSLQIFFPKTESI